MSDAHATPVLPRVLMGPGPGDVPPRVLEALGRPTLGHLDPIFIETMDAVRAKLRTVFGTENDLTLAVSGTGSAGMEACLVNLIEPGDTMLVFVNGVFGGRMVDVAGRCGATVERVDLPWGRAFDPEQVIGEIRRVRPTAVGIVHAETSTGVHQPLDGIGEACREVGSLLVADCVTSLAGVPVEIDENQIDAAYSGTQKCLSCPPGLAPATFGPRAVEKLDNRKSKVASWYLDLTMVRNYWGGDRAYHHTAPTNMLVALNEALDVVLEEGLENRYARHRAAHERLKAGLAEMGASYLSDPDHTLPQLNAIGIPDGLTDADRRRLLDEYGIEIGGGLGEYKGKAWRIGLMGHTASTRNVDLLLAALRSMRGAAN